MNRCIPLLPGFPFYRQGHIAIETVEPMQETIKRKST